MPYERKFLEAVQILGNLPSTGVNIAALSSSAQGPYSWDCLTPVAISRMLVHVTTTFQGTAGNNVAIQLVRQPVFNSTSASVVIGTVNIPTTAVAGSVFYKELNPSIASTGVGVGNGGNGFISGGSQVTWQWTTAPSSGVIVVDFEGEYVPERPANYPVNTFLST